FTPGFITMYMCRETIRRAVVQKFNEVKGWDCKELTDLYNKIEDSKEANSIINGLKICDPAVGSGHFLVSALNEIIAIKADLNILLDREGRRLKEYQVEVVNDELSITDEEGTPFSYNINSKESQRFQEALFHEKQTIIENCLFGVDINPNSVKICRLRLWIELLKNAYYKTHPTLSQGEGPGVRHLETLPNIDINIKTGNSLISRFALDADLKKALKKSKFGPGGIDSYRFAVKTYQNARNKEEKREMEQLIRAIKSDFRTEIANYDPRKIRRAKLLADRYLLTGKDKGGFGMMLFEDTADYSSKNAKLIKERAEKLLNEVAKIDASLEEDEKNIIYENAFEWRFEFPQVLNDEGDFVGFDVVIGNPPYIPLESFSEIERRAFKTKYVQFERKYETSVMFIVEGFDIL
ncbi:MAG: type II restriction endonuclease, partial [Daejeonella sp.]|nr:type II restriction endonuclease [Daejeonella sp.]